MKHRIEHAPTFTTLEFDLDEGDVVSAQPGCMLAMTTGLDVTAAIDAKAKEALIASIPLGRTGAPEDVALLVDYLCGPGGAYITGQTFVVDGGLSL